MNPVGLEEAWVRQLMASWYSLNLSHFGERMRPPSMRLSDAETQLGLWQPAIRTISLSRKLCGERPWGMVIEVLKHEMAHQYVHEVLGVFDETAHGPAFQQLCAKLAIDGVAVGAPSLGEEHETSERARLLQKVTKLLALAESQNQHEAEAAMSAAQKLMLKHNIDVATRTGYAFKHLGTVKARILEPERRVGALLAAHFFVEAIWVPSFDAQTGDSGTVLEICGTPENLAMAEYVHGFLTQTAERLWREHKKKEGITKNRERLAYLAGVIQGFEDTLAQKQKAHKEEGLIWLGDADLTRFYRARHPYIRNVRHTGASGSARNDGRAAGRNLVLHRPMHEGPSSGPRKLLNG